MLNTQAESLRGTAEKERVKLWNLYQGRSRPSLKSLNNRKEQDEVVYIVCREFINRWRSFIKYARKNLDIEVI